MASVEKSTRRTKIYQAAFFDAKRALYEKSDPTFPDPHLLKEQLPPSIDLQNYILHFAPPPEIQDNNMDYDTMEAQMMNKIDSYAWNSKLPFATDINYLKDHIRNRENAMVLTNAIKEGFSYTKKPNRRTGELTYLHSVRTYFRGQIDASYVGFSKASSYHTSLLARILHDVKEDIGGFRIDPPKELNGNEPVAYSIHFDNQKNPYEVTLRPSEARLLEMQINALSIPPEIENMTDKKQKSEKQIEHLLSESEKIAKEFGPFEGYQTLRIKLDDRIDNVLTYYSLNGENSKEKLREKLEETIQLFRKVEHYAKAYFNEYKKFELYNTSIPLPQVDSDESVVALCYYLLRGGTYQEFLEEPLEKAREKLNGVRRANLGSLYHNLILIPSLNPASMPRSVGAIPL